VWTVNTSRYCETTAAFMLTFVVIDSGRLVDCMCLDMQKLNILDEYLHNLHLLLLKVLKLFPLNGIKQTVQL